MTSRRKLARHPGGVLMTLLLVVLLAFGNCPCLRLAHADPAPSSAVHDCCPDSVAMPDAPTKPESAPSPCNDGHCLQVTGHCDAVDRPLSPIGNPYWPAQPLAVAQFMPLDWLGGHHPLLFNHTETARPPPDQRSRVLRL